MSSAGNVAELEAMGFGAESAKAAVVATVSAQQAHSAVIRVSLRLAASDKKLLCLVFVAMLPGWRRAGSGGMACVSRDFRIPNTACAIPA